MYKDTFFLNIKKELASFFSYWSFYEVGFCTPTTITRPSETLNFTS